MCDITLVLVTNEYFDISDEWCCQTTLTNFTSIGFRYKI